MLIYLLRHGLTEYNAEKRYQGQRDIPLSAAGRAALCRVRQRGVMNTVLGAISARHSIARPAAERGMSRCP